MRTAQKATDNVLQKKLNVRLLFANIAGLKIMSGIKLYHWNRFWTKQPRVYLVIGEKLKPTKPSSKALVCKYVNANEDVLSIMQDISKLVLSKTDLPKAQSVQELGLFKQNILRELKKQRKTVKQAKQKLL